MSRARYNNLRKITWAANYSDLITARKTLPRARIRPRVREARFVAASHKRAQAYVPARAKRSRLCRVYGGADLSAEHCLPVKRSRNEATRRSGRLVSASASSSPQSSPLVRAKEPSPSGPSYNSPGIMFKYYRVGHTPATILPCTRSILQIPRASSRLRAR